VNGKPPVHLDLVGYHSGNFIFSRRRICRSLLAALKRDEQPDTTTPE
jgi:hypothetical protein